jgi:protein disulfide-isomerase A6
MTIISRNLLICASLLLQIPKTFGLYDSSSDVQTFENKSDFRNRVLESDSIWMVQFYAPWCGHCKQLASTYTQIATMLKGIIPVGAVDASSDGPQKRIAADYGVSGFPTLKIFGDDKKKPVDVRSRDPNEILQQLMELLQSTVQKRAGAAGQSGGSSSSSSSRGSGRSGKASSKVLQLTTSNFSEKVYDNDEVVLVAFIAPWCGHCKALHGEWESAAAKLDGTGAVLGTVDATVEESLAREYGVQGFPTIKVFPGGKGKSARSASDYQGGREEEQIVQYALAEVDRSGVPKEIPEMVNADIMKENCDGSNRICVFFALPHILETGAEGRNKYRDIMAAASKAVRGMSFHFLWFEGGSQPDLENTLELTFGFPAVAAYSVDKGVYTVHRSSFTEANIRKFLTGITTGRQRTLKISKVPSIETVEPWDGEDGAPFEEEFSLEDIMGDDDDEL